MKTKISHLGRSTVSVILAVMMLLSTMLIGTVSTVNAATSTKKVFLLNAANWKTPKAYCWDGGNNNTWPGKDMTKEGTLEGSDVYSFTPTTGYSKIIFNDSGDSTTQTATLDYPTTDNQMYNNYTKQWTTYSGGSGGGSTEATYYLGGRVGQNLESDTWLGFTKDYEFQKTETSGLYKYDSKQTPVQWTQTRGNGLKQYFFVHTGSSAEWYGSTQETSLTSANQATTLKNYYNDNDTNTNRLLYIDSSDTSGNVTFWFDTRNSDKQLYYTVGSESSQTPVAQSVSLTASSETVTSGGSTTLTATLTNKAEGVGNVTYTFKTADGTEVDTVENTDKETASVEVNNITSDTTYTVTVSADNYKSITSNEATVTVEAKKTFYLFNSKNNDIATWPDGNGIEMKLVGGKYVAQLDLEYSDTGANHYFAINDSSNKPTKDSQLWHGKTEYSITENAENVTGADRQDYNQVYYFYFAYHNLNSVTIEFDGVSKVTITDGGSTAKTVTITVPQVENATVTAFVNSTPYNEGESFDINEGSSFTVNVEGDNGYTLKKITYGTKTGTETGAEFTAKSGVNTFNVDMVQTVSNPFTVTFGPNNSDYGTVSATKGTTPLESPATVNMRDEVTIKATPSGSNYIFKSWSITGDYVIKDSKTTSDAEITLVVYSDITATASFTETSPYQVAYGLNGTLMRMNKTKYDGVYISTGTIDHSTDDKNPNSHFTIYDTANNQYASISASGYYWLKNENLSKTMGGNDSWKGNYEHGSGKGLINNACSSAKYVVYNANTKTITLTGDPDYGTKATLYVKNGTYSTSFTTGATKDYAGSSVAAGLATTKTDPCNTYSVAFDTNVNVQTTLTDKYRKAGYYVGAYCVNGRNYTASAKNADQGIYQANITITEDLAENGVVEVTPIYYNRTIEKDDNYITFYVDAERLVGGWGSTVAIYAYAYEGGTAIYGSDGKPTNNVNLLGAYPGQPMVKDGQYYVAKIPRCNYVISSDDGSLKIDKTSPVAGITLNNYYNETVHNSLVPIKRNMQTYDFSDFVALANKKDVKTIMFQSKFYNATGDAKRNTKVIYGYDTEISDPTKATTQIDNIKSANVNPYEDFTDYYGRATDLIGNILDDNQKDDANNLYVISTGSYNNQSSDYSTKGQWVTIWNVYDHSGNLITYGTPADFLNENTSQYKAIAEKYKGKPVKISYEKGLSYDNGVTSRTDGRWYYSTLGQEFTSDVAIEYKGVDDKYIADTNTNTANTGFVGVTTKATATINNVTTASFSSVTDTAHLNIKVANGWRFDGWFIKQGDKYTEVSDNYTDISTDVLMSNSYHIVARVSEIPTGTLELNHTAYTGTDPAAHTGTGFYYISAVVKKADNSKIEFDETQGVISIPDFAATDELTITLRAKCHGDNTVYALYKGEAGGYTKIGDKDYEGDPSFSYTFKVSANSLFEGDKLAVNALNYYTDIVKVGGTCDITYKYYDRFSVEGEGKRVSYVVRNVELSSEEIQDKYQPSNSTITKYAPRIDTMYVDTKWKLDVTGMVEKGKSQATVIATQTPKTCKVYHPVLGDNGYYNPDIQDRTPYTVEFNSLLKDENGNFLLTTPEYNVDKTLKFAYWEVYKVNKNGQSEGEVVTKCYERNFGLRIMADYYIVPVYSENVPNLTANINSPVLNREIYGDSANPTDKLYVDLLTAFTSTAIPTFKENTTPLKVECGVFVVRNNTKTLSVDHRNTLVNAAISNSTDTTSDILKGYIRDVAVEGKLITKLEDLAKDSNVKDKTNTVANFGNDEYRITKLVFDNNSLTNKNRIDEVLKFTNNTANQNYIFTAYAFVVIKDSNGDVKDMCISKSQYFNLCYVGNKALDNN